jgi:hypothetical protein
MNRRTRLMFTGAACILLFGCRGDTVSPKTDIPMFAVSDGAHNGNPDFFFLPPLFKSPVNDPNYEPNAANMSLKPAVEICELGAAAADGSRQCIAGPPLKRFDPSVVTVSLTDQSYQVNWHTDESALDPAKYYRIRVLVGTSLLGFADVDPVSNGSQLKNVQTNEYIGLVDGRTLPIKFRIETGALCAVDGTPCGAGTINLSQGGGVELQGDGEDFHVDIPSGTTATFNGQPVTNVTLNLEVCPGIDVDLPTFGPCLRVSTFFDATGTGELQFSNPVLISMCVLNSVYHTPDETRQEDLITLHQQDGTLIRALPHAEPNCNVIGSKSSGWGWLKSLAARLLAPQSAYAATRSAVLHVGAGGETSVTGSTCTTSSSPVQRSLPAGITMTTTCPPSSPVARSGSGPQRSVMAAITPPLTVSDFQFALPAKMDYLNSDDAQRSAPAGTALPTAVKVTDWDGNPVQGARVTFTEPAIEGLSTPLGVAISNADGVAEIQWTIRAGPNTAVASGRGIAAQNNYPNGVVKPFMPDISQPANLESPVALGTGRITFNATGEVPATPVLDQQNLLDGQLGGQGIGRFSDIDGTPDPDGTSFDFQDAQMFTVGTSGQLAQIRVPLINLSQATVDVTLDVVATTNGVPDETHSFGSVAIPAASISTNINDTGNPAAWASADVTSLKIVVTAGQQLAFIVRSLSTSAYLYNPEFTSGYANGTGYRRNRALTAGWTTTDQDFGFQTFVIPN